MGRSYKGGDGWVGSEMSRGSRRGRVRVAGRREVGLE